MEKSWLMVLHTDHIPGVAANIAVAFSRRGIQLDSICAEDDPNSARGAIRALVSVTFRAMEERMAIVRRKLERMEVVHRIDVWDSNASPALAAALREHIAGRQRSLAAIMANQPQYRSPDR